MYFFRVLDEFFFLFFFRFFDVSLFLDDRDRSRDFFTNRNGLKALCVSFSLGREKREKSRLRIIKQGNFSKLSSFVAPQELRGLFDFITSPSDAIFLNKQIW